ncbi:peptide deformylase [Paenibacillus flagellatus]|uniref:Peptide deformylase n=1 Tax=Paenibacillus flagellatus TaxID=2211139 RepID=A0A2V5JUX9_9BACL|nr:peptide deformylase [Paenibacillus flagellatus]PYI50495.1 peptide deformylase [Paenibacillus flagellatus]
MAERQIRKIGDPVLRETCRPVPAVTPNVVKLLDDLAETIRGGDNRAGLAAPQVGIAKRVAVLEYDHTGLIELINPVIVERSGERTGHEACLSIPGVYGTVKRSQYVKVKTWDRQGNETFIEGEDEVAVCLQHEIDHLDGVLYIDRVKPGELFNELSDKPIDVLQMIKLSRSGQ